MGDSYVQVATDGSGKKVDNTDVTTGAGTVYRQRISLADGATAAANVKVTNAEPSASDYGLATRPLLPVVTTTDTLTSLNDTVTLALLGRTAASVYISGTFVQTILPKLSIDGGTTYVTTFLLTKDGWDVASALDGSSNNGPWQVVLVPGTTHVRLETSNFTSGTCTVVVAATLGGQLFATPGDIVPPVTTTFAPFTRPIPYGTTGVTLSNVNDTASSTTLLSSNAARVGATIFNDSTQTLYVKFGTTASSTSFTVKIAAGGYYEVPYSYTGRIDGIWAADASGAARMTEITG
jgi:hypothetical protein